MRSRHDAFFFGRFGLQNLLMLISLIAQRAIAFPATYCDNATVDDVVRYNWNKLAR